MRNGHTYVRMHYEGHLYPPPPDVQRNLNLVPLYAAPVAAPVAQPLTDEQIDAVVRSVQPHLDAGCKAWKELAEQCRYWLEAERAHGITPKGPA